MSTRNFEGIASESQPDAGPRVCVSLGIELCRRSVGGAKVIKASIFRISGLGMLIGVAALTLVACSDEPKSKAEGQLSLMIDQKAVISEKFSKDEALERHKELLDVFETACQVAYFFQSMRQDGQKGSGVNLTEISTTDNILICQSGRLSKSSDPLGFPGCSIRPRRDGDTQQQYLLALRDFLRDRQKMEESAMLRRISKESNDRWSREINQLYVVRGNSLSCSDAIATTENK